MNYKWNAKIGPYSLTSPRFDPIKMLNYFKITQTIYGRIAVMTYDNQKGHRVN